MFCRFAILLWLSWSLCVARLSSAEAAPPTTEDRFSRRFTAAEMGGKGAVRSVAVGPDGHVWALSSGGVHEFDGQVWHTVPGLDGDAVKGVQGVAVSPSGRVWYAGVSELGWLEKDSAGGWTPHAVPCAELNEPSPAGSAYLRFVFLRDETYVLFGRRSLLVRIDAAGAAHRQPLGEEGRSLHVWENAVHVQTLQKAWRVENGRVEPLAADAPLWKNWMKRPLLAVWPREAGDYWVAAQAGLRYWNRADDTLYATAEVTRALGGVLVTAAVPLSDGRAALATQSKGILIAEGMTGKVLERLDAAAGLGPGGDLVFGVATANDGALWIAHSGGLACIAARRLAAPTVLPPGSSKPLSPRFSGLPLIRRFSENETGLNSFNWDVTVHSNGLVYAANTGGILEFDGVSWRTLPGGICFRVVSDARRGRLFYGEAKDFGELVPDASGRLRREPLSRKLPAEQSSGQWRAVLVSGSDVYFLASDRRLLVRLDAQDSLHVIPLPRTLLSIVEWQGRVYLCDTGVYFRVAGDSLESVLDPPTVLQPAKLGVARSIWPTEDGGAWVFTSAGGPFRVTREGQASASGEVARATASVLATAGLPLPDGTFAIATNSLGVIRADAEQRVLAQYDEDRGLGPASGSVYGLALDREGGLWTAHSGGLTRLQVSGPGALHGLAKGLRGPVSPMALHRGRLYAGTRQGLFVRDPVTGVFSVVPGVTGTVSGLHSLAEGLLIVAGRVWLRDDRGGLAELGGMSAIYDGLAEFPSDPNHFLVFTNQGLQVYGRAAGKWAAVGFVQNTQERYSYVSVDAAGFVWFQRASGQLLRLDFRSGVRLDAPAVVIGAAQGLKDTGRVKRQFVHDGVLMLVVDHRLLRYDPATDRFVPETRIAGLENEEVTALTFPLSDGSLLLTHIEGARRTGFAQPAGPGAWKMAWEPYTAFESVSATNALLDPASQTLWIGSYQAATQLASYDLAVPRPASQPPSVRVRAVISEERTVWGGAGTMPTEAWRPAQTAVKFAYAAPTFRADTLGNVEVEYRTQLGGFDRGWSAWSKDTSRAYTNLPPGSFTFRVQARGDDHREGAVATYEFHLLPPWWRTWWFIGFASVTGVGSVAGIARWLGNRALRRELERVEAQSAVERERLRLARDLHDEIGSGLGRVILFAGEARRGKSDPTKLDAALDRVRDSAQELIQHAREIVWAVSPQHDTLASVIERVGDYVEETLRSAGITCRVETPAQVPETAPLGSDVRHSLFLAVKEAVHNCVKYSGATTAECRFELGNDQLVIVLRDHGRGFAPGELRGTGHGLPNIAARLQALGGSGVITSAPGQGTTVTLRVPLGKKVV